MPASKSPQASNESHWTDKGDWLALAHQLDAESLFFVGQEPIAVLASLPDGEDEARFFNRVWCMARPQLFFLARAGELAVYQLTKPPVRGNESINSNGRQLALARSASEIQEQLADFRREALESGMIYGDERFSSGAFRADRALVHDLKTVRRLLITEGKGLDASIAHSLIGRALFVRYLEDRRIITPDYFQSVAARHREWRLILASEEAEHFAEPELASILFFKVLKDKDFTYALFEQLAADFNGDIFPVSSEESREVKPAHLLLLRRLLMGDSVSPQQQLFLFAYRFDIIPIELISSIYEEFYTAHRGKGKNQSSYYTPPALVDFLLSQVLTERVLDQRPRVIDPACGSGIFLVETFRRMVRQRVRKHGRRLSQRELRCILRDQIAGIDLNPEAVPVTAFSLYLAYLHYQEPREINVDRRLPNLRWNPDRKERQPDQHFDILYSGNAFEAIDEEDAVAHAHFGPACADIVVGNPPWGEIKRDDDLGRRALPAILDWCKEKKERVIGDLELSQAFVHLATELLRDGGKAALLLSSGVLFKQHVNSRQFRQSWLTRCKLRQVINFAHVRHLFFSDAGRPTEKGHAVRESAGVAPFISVVFAKESPPEDHRFAYWSAKRTLEVEKSRALILSRADMHWLNQTECLRYESLWKIYWWGTKRDEGLIRTLERFPSLEHVLRERDADCLIGQGYTPGNAWPSPEWMMDYSDLLPDAMVRYSPLSNMPMSPPPQRVEYRPRSDELFKGPRLLVRRGIGGVDKRPIVARLETSPFCFRSSVNAFRLDSMSDEERLLALGVYWSSLTEYYFWLTAHSWGLWHDELQKEVAGKMPLCLTGSKGSTKRVISATRALRDSAPLFEQEIQKLESELDEAVFDLYELNEADRDLVRDMSRFGLDFYYRRSSSNGVAPLRLPSVRHGLASDLPQRKADGLIGYLQVFLRQWNAELVPDGELGWEAIEGPSGAPILALLFCTTPKGDKPSWVTDDSSAAWADVLGHMEKNSLVALDAQKMIYTDTFIRAVSEHEILIVKRNEQRFWTRSMAREDADTTLVQAMRLSEQSR
ncbi:HsdM family class I SAM-dependent methyltransferase [Pyxidicoccus trucidator]|uniref:HsdM family class I SAM-dependent methyltransferase n=1 Tax=Pyxidicoccus trucidator TaxID=2709662 RepID=UPI0013DBE91C|nr:N-6 DNA methylase [Pyxidicoccus trucidator]